LRGAWEFRAEGSYAAEYWRCRGKFPFTDLHSFKDYVIYVQTYLPDDFRPREGVGPDEQWSMELAFRGLREGLKLAAQEKGPGQVFTDCEQLVEDAYLEYLAGRKRAGFFKLEEVNKLLRRVPTQ
jgi:hypothetical protein